MNKEDKLKAYLDEYGSEILTSYSDQDKSSFEIYRENTADGYEVFVAKYSGNNGVYIPDDVHYYENDLEQVIIETIHNGESIYIDEDLFDDLYIEDTIADMYDKWQQELEENEKKSD